MIIILPVLLGHFFPFLRPCVLDKRQMTWSHGILTSRLVRCVCLPMTTYVCQWVQPHQTSASRNNSVDGKTSVLSARQDRSFVQGVLVTGACFAHILKKVDYRDEFGREDVGPARKGGRDHWQDLRWAAWWQEVLPAGCAAFQCFESYLILAHVMLWIILNTCTRNALNHT